MTETDPSMEAYLASTLSWPLDYPNMSERDRRILLLRSDKPLLAALRINTFDLQRLDTYRRRIIAAARTLAPTRHPRRELATATATTPWFVRTCYNPRDMTDVADLTRPGLEFEDNAPERDAIYLAAKLTPANSAWLREQTHGDTKRYPDIINTLINTARTTTDTP